MHNTEFTELMERDFEAIREIRSTKGADYAGEADALRNFKDAADQLGVTPEQVWAIYAHKHWSAIMSYCRDGSVQSEGIEGRLHDLITYTLLLHGLIEERDHTAPR